MESVIEDLGTSDNGVGLFVLVLVLETGSHVIQASLKLDITGGDLKLLTIPSLPPQVLGLQVYTTTLGLCRA